MSKEKTPRKETDPRLRTFLRTVSFNWQGMTFWLILGGLILFQWDWFKARADWWITTAMYVMQMMMYMLFAIMQFVAIFWFLARGRVYWIDPGETGITFADYRGNPQVLEVANRIVTLLRGVKKFKQMGGETSRGLLLIGPPGTGKSYLAQAISTEAGVPFCYASAPSFQNMFFGVGNLRVMNIYRIARKKARKYGACIVFIDEIDAIGMSRAGQTGMGMGGFFGGGLGLLNELLLQMDPPNIEHGFINKLLRKLGLRSRKADQPNVLTIGATNLAEILDKALLRPGRFDRKIMVDYPDYDGRKDVLEYYLRKVKHDPNLSMDRLASDTIGYSPVQIKHVINEAVVVAHFEGRDMITYKDVMMAREINEWGLRQPIRSMSKEDKRRIAYHEAGHCVAMYLLQPLEPPVKATIIRHTGFLGAVQGKPLEERYTWVREEILADIQISLASRAAERLFLGTEMTGVSGDLRQATQLAAAYIGLWGMGGSLFSYGANMAPGQVSVPTDPHLKHQVEKLLDEQYQRVSRLVEENADAVHAIARGLLDKEELDKDEIKEIMDANRELRRPTAAFQQTFRS
jgi:cell division protease FtsH